MRLVIEPEKKRYLMLKSRVHWRAGRSIRSIPKPRRPSEPGGTTSRRPCFP
jgi:hypothetical protein